jgi:hypothetical protein
MSLRLYERTAKELPSRADIYFEKKFLFDRDKPLIVKADLDRESYTEDDTITINLSISRSGPRGHGIRKIKIEIYQQVTVVGKRRGYRIREHQKKKTGTSKR